MAEYTVLSKAPITEALIDIRVKLPEDLKVDKLNSLYDAIASQYSERKERMRSEVRFDFKKGEPPKLTAGDKIDGYLFISSDKRQIVQARLDGFTFSRLKPYETWERFHDEAYRLWQLYVDITSPELITRAALRYINHMDIPLPIRDFSDYLTAPPIVPEDLPQGVSSFLTRVVIHEPSINATAIITQALEQIIKPDFVPIILDIDVFRQIPDGMKREEAWKTIGELRHFKNRIFFKSVTEKLKGLFL